MKILLKTTLLALLLLTFSCSKDDSTEQEPVVPATVTNMSPLSGPKTTVVTFTGTNFGTDINAVQVFFDGIEATVQSVTDTQIQTVVPPRAFEGQVNLIINGTAFNDFNFEYVIVDIEVSTFAGGDGGFADGNGTNAQFINPLGIAKDNSGNLYIADSGNRRIRKITPDGTVSTLAGNGQQGFADGTGENATFIYPADVAVDNLGNIYVADYSKIRKITPNGIVSTLAGADAQGFADGSGINAQFNAPQGIAVDSEGMVYVSDTNNHKIRKITPEGIVTTIAGSTSGFNDGNASSAQFTAPYGIDIDGSGFIYIADIANSRIRRITPESTVSTIAGIDAFGFVDGPSATAQLDLPTDVTIDALGNIYITELGNNSIRKISTNGNVTTVAGTGDNGFANGIGATALFDQPFGLIIDDDFTIYLVDTTNHQIRKITQE